MTTETSQSSDKHNPQSENTVRAAIAEDSSRLSEILSKDPQIIVRIKECVISCLPRNNMGKYLRGSLYDQLGLLLKQKEAAQFVIRVLEWGDPELMDKLKSWDGIPGNVIEFLEEMYITFGHSLRRAERALSKPRDWHRINVDTMYDSDHSPLLSVKLERNDGQAIEITGPVGSVIRLQQHIVDQLTEDIKEISDTDLNMLKKLSEGVTALIAGLDNSQGKGDTSG